jgi:hypothetical protein
MSRNRHNHLKNPLYYVLVNTVGSVAATGLFLSACATGETSENPGVARANATETASVMTQELHSGGLEAYDGVGSLHYKQGGKDKAINRFVWLSKPDGNLEGEWVGKVEHIANEDGIGMHVEISPVQLPDQNVERQYSVGHSALANHVTLSVELAEDGMTEKLVASPIK